MENLREAGELTNGPWISPNTVAPRSEEFGVARGKILPQG